MSASEDADDVTAVSGGGEDSGRDNAGGGDNAGRGDKSGGGDAAAVSGGDNGAVITSSQSSQPKSVRSSPVWDHFVDTEKPQFVRCKHCDKKV